MLLPPRGPGRCFGPAGVDAGEHDELGAGFDAQVVGADDADTALAEADGVGADECDGVAFGEGAAAVVDGLGRGRVVGHGPTVPWIRLGVPRARVCGQLVQVAWRADMLKPGP